MEFFGVALNFIRYCFNYLYLPLSEVKVFNFSNQGITDVCKNYLMHKLLVTNSCIFKK
jgi:hypothetical protein